jgi:hypothetical protein
MAPSTELSAGSRARACRDDAVAMAVRERLRDDENTAVWRAAEAIERSIDLGVITGTQLDDIEALRGRSCRRDQARGVGRRIRIEQEADAR